MSPDAPARYELDDLVEVCLDPDYLTGAGPRAGVTARGPDDQAFVPADLEAIETGCAFMAQARDHPERQPEPWWLRQLSVVGRCAGGDDLAHARSRGHPGYSPRETIAKLEHALRAGPATCVYVEQRLGFAGCATCVYRGKIKSPIQLGRTEAHNRPRPAEAAPPPGDGDRDGAFGVFQNADVDAQAPPDDGAPPIAGPGTGRRPGGDEEADGAGDDEEAEEEVVLPPIPDYPTEKAPERIKALITAYPGLPAAYLAGAGLAAAAVAIGGNASIRVVEGREERANVWASLVGPPGSGKSPAQDLAFAVLRAHDAEHRTAYDQALRAWRALEPKARLDVDRPKDDSLLRRDTTVEAIARRLYASGGDLGLDVDELRTLIAGLGQYKTARTGGRGGGTDSPDLAKFLELWHGGPWHYTRVGTGGGGENAIDLLIARPTLVLCGSVQMEYQHLLGAEGDGLRPRWLPHLATFAPPLPERSEAELARAATEATQAGTVWAERLTELIERRNQQRVWTLDPKAQLRFYALDREWKERAGSPEESASTAAALRKADRQLLRLVLVACELDDPGGTTGGLTVTAKRIDAVVPQLEFCLSCWRVLPTATALALTYQHAVLNEAVDKLAFWLEHHGGASTPRGLLRAHVAGVRTRGDLNLLLKRYLATFPGTIKPTTPGPRGGRPGRLVLAPKRATGGTWGGYVAIGDIPPTHPPQTTPGAVAGRPGGATATPGSRDFKAPTGAPGVSATNPPGAATNPPDLATNPGVGDKTPAAATNPPDAPPWPASTNGTSGTAGPLPYRDF